MGIFNRGKRLKEVLIKEYVDIHSHILPGVDDGAKNITESKNILNGLSELGFEKLMPTPHIMKGVWDNTPENLFDAYGDLKNELSVEQQNMIPTFAAEYLVDTSFLNTIRQGEILFLGDQYVLLEFSFAEKPKMLFDVISELKLRDYKIILAHPERYAYYHGKKYLLEEIKNYDVYFQLNLLSTVGHYGKKIMKAAESLLETNFIDFTGSDVHRMSDVYAFDHKVQIKSIKKLQKAMENNQKLLNSYRPSEKKKSLSQ